MSAHSPEHVHKQVKIYKLVFAALAVGTVVTVLAANVHLGIIIGIIVALIIALVKGSLVAGYFMHLFSERKLIYGILALTAVFAIAMVVLIALTYGDQQGSHHGIFEVPARHVQTQHAGSHGEEPAKVHEAESHVP